MPYFDSKEQLITFGGKKGEKINRKKKCEQKAMSLKKRSGSKK